VPAEGGLHRADLPAALDHASAEVDEFDAALVRGAGGVPAPAEAAAAAEAEFERERAGVATDVVPPGRRGGNGAGAGGVAAPEEEAPERPVGRRESRRSLAARAVAFLRASWAELQRVQWPDRPAVSQATAVVLGFVAVAGIYLGAADWVAQKIVNFVL
jgi:preprotein translocase SecE subunit